MDRARRIVLAASVVVLAGFLASCGPSNVRLGWVETSAPGHLKASYAKFTGAETRMVQVQAGKTLHLEYDAEVGQGFLSLGVDDPYGVTIWCVYLCEDCGETTELPLNAAGCYTISVRGEAAEGGFDLRWEQR